MNKHLSQSSARLFIKNVLVVTLLLSCSGCVKLENHSYDCDESSVLKQGIDKLDVDVKAYGQRQTLSDSGVYSKYRIGSPYNVKVYFLGNRRDFSKFSVSQVLATFSPSSKTVEFDSMTSDSVYDSNSSSDMMPDSRIVSLEPELSTKAGENFVLTLYGNITDDAGSRRFSYQCNMVHSYKSETAFALVN